MINELALQGSNWDNWFERTFGKGNIERAREDPKFRARYNMALNYRVLMSQTDEEIRLRSNNERLIKIDVFHESYKDGLNILTDCLYQADSHQQIADCILRRSLTVEKECRRIRNTTGVYFQS